MIAIASETSCDFRMAFPYPRLNGVLASKSSRAFRVITVGLLSCFSSLAAWALSIDQLTTNARTNPLGISGDDVSFGWAVVADERDSTQTAYQIRIGPTEGSSDVWDSGRWWHQACYRESLR